MPAIIRWQRGEAKEGGWKNRRQRNKGRYTRRGARGFTHGKTLSMDPDGGSKRKSADPGSRGRGGRKRAIEGIGPGGVLGVQKANVTPGAQ